MKVYAISVLRRGDDPSVILSQTKDLSSFSFYQRGSVGEFMDFFSKTLSDKVRQGERTSVQENDYIAHVYNSGLTTELVAVIITDKEYPARAAFGLISTLLEQFQSAVPNYKELSSTPSTNPFPAIDTILVKYQDPKEADPILRVQHELDETKIVLHKTIESVLQRGEKLDDLVSRSNELSVQSRMFYKTAKKQNSCCVIM